VSRRGNAITLRDRPLPLAALGYSPLRWERRGVTYAAMSPTIYNFSAGPAVLPAPVLEHVGAELTDLGGSGMSIVEISHRGSAFRKIAEKTEADLRRILAIPDDYRVLFMQGGATLQFAAVPLNLTPAGGSSDHLITGEWSRRAAAEAAKFGAVNVAADGSPSGYHTIPDRDHWSLDPHATYVAHATNETINGVEFPAAPDVGGVPLVADMSSTILSRPIAVGDYGLIYFGAQKNLGPAGLTIVIVRADLIGTARADTPTILDYAVVARSESMLNTPPTFAWYVAGLVLEWLESEGGVAAMETRNRRKKDRLYGAIDASGLYRNEVDPRYRSWTNVPFALTDPGLEARFLTDAEAEGLVNLKGHRSVGGMRASLYNAMPEEGVAALTEFMDQFERRWRDMGADAGENS